MLTHISPECRRRKVKCDERYPQCTQCEEADLVCHLQDSLFKMHKTPTAFANRPARRAVTKKGAFAKKKPPDHRGWDTDARVDAPRKQKLPRPARAGSSKAATGRASRNAGSSSTSRSELQSTGASLLHRSPRCDDTERGDRQSPETTSCSMPSRKHAATPLKLTPNA